MTLGEAYFCFGSKFKPLKTSLMKFGYELLGVRGGLCNPSYWDGGI